MAEILGKTCHTGTEKSTEGNVGLSRLSCWTRQSPVSGAEDSELWSEISLFMETSDSKPNPAAKPTLEELSSHATGHTRAALVL